jgi:hypothetical protein
MKSLYHFSLVNYTTQGKDLLIHLLILFNKIYSKTYTFFYSTFLLILFSYTAALSVIKKTII